MMTIHVLGAGDGYRYLTDQVAGGDGARAAGQDLTDYYQATGNPAGRWLGLGAEVLGVEGAVSTAQMHNLYGLGLHPVTGSQLGRRFQVFKTVEERVRDRLDAIAAGGQPATPDVVAQVERAELAKGERQAVAGFDLVFSPVKSVSLAWALADDPRVTAEVEAAHHASVAHVIDWLERDVVFARAGAAGVVQLDVAGVAVAGFDHRTSRAGDPDLHTHAVLSNKVLARYPDGRTKWLTVDSAALHKAAVAASERYNRVLEDEVSRRLGWRFAVRADQDVAEPTAIRELEFMPLDAVRGFSARRAQVEARYATLLADYHRSHGHTPPRAVQYALAQQATLAGRPAKELVETVGGERARWASQAAGMLDRVQWGQLQTHLRAGLPVALSTARDVSDAEVAILAAAALADVTERRSTWTVRHVQAAALRATRGYSMASAEAREQLVARVVDAVLAAAPGVSDAVCLDPPELVEAPPELRRRSGESMFVPHASARWTTHRQLAAEAALVEHAQRTDAPRVGVDDVGVAALSVQRGGSALTADQLGAVEHLATSGRGVGLLIGPAGTGKTTAVRALVTAWTAGTGRLVHGLAPTAVAAAVLKAETGMASAETVHMWQTTGPELLSAGDLVVVDEAGMVGTARLLDVLDRARAAGAKVILVGDHRQLGAIESGGALRLLATDAPDAVAELTSVWRFADVDPATGERVVRRWEADASLRLRVGDVAGLEPYLAHDRVNAGVQAVLLDELYGRWLAETGGGLTSVMIASTTDLVAELGRRARADRVAAGQVEPSGVALADGTLGGVGDVVVTRRNNRLLLAGREYVKNGDLWVVEARGADGSLEVRHTGHGGRVRLPADYVAERVEQGYAMTVHRAQGSTVDSAHVLVDDSYSRELFYVAMTRGRLANVAHVVTDHVLDPDLERPPAPARLARQVLARVLARESGDRSATETQREAWAQADSLRTLLPRYRFTEELFAGGRARDVLAQAVAASLAERVAGSPAWGALATRMELLEARGVDVREALSATVLDRPLDGAEDPAAVLHYRLAGHVAGSRPGAGDWLPCPPAEDGDVPVYLRALRASMDDRVTSLGAVAAAELPAWTSALPRIGDPELDPTGMDRDEWERLAGRVAAYREAFDVADADPLGPVPAEPLQAEAHALLRSALDAAADAVGRAGAPTLGEVAARLEAARRRMAIAAGDHWRVQREGDRAAAGEQLRRRVADAQVLLGRLDEAAAAGAAWQAEARAHAGAVGELARQRVLAESADRRAERRAAAAAVTVLAAEVEQRAARVAEARDWAVAAELGLPVVDAREAARVDAARTVAEGRRLHELAAAADQAAAEQRAERAAQVAAAYGSAGEELAAAEAAARAAGLQVEHVDVDPEEAAGELAVGRDVER